jgi:hypothetical protein
MGNEDVPSKPSSACKAQDRLAQVRKHVAPDPNTSRRRRRKSVDDDLPADYSDIMGQIATLQKIAATPDPKSRGYVRQKQAGKLWVRERVDALLDKGSFKEVGSVSGTVKWKKIGEAREEPVECKISSGQEIYGSIIDKVLRKMYRRTTFKGLEC